LVIGVSSWRLRSRTTKNTRKNSKKKKTTDGGGDDESHRKYETRKREKEVYDKVNMKGKVGRSCCYVSE